MPEEKEDTRRYPRLPIKASIKFKPLVELTEAISLDMSKSGIRFRTEKPLRIALQIAVGKDKDIYTAKLVWARRDEDGRMHYGFEYDQKKKRKPPDE